VVDSQWLIECTAPQAVRAVLTKVGPEPHTPLRMEKPLQRAGIVRERQPFHAPLLKRDSLGRAMFSTFLADVTELGEPELDRRVVDEGHVCENLRQGKSRTVLRIHEEAVPPKLPQPRFYSHWYTESRVVPHGDGVVTEVPDVLSQGWSRERHL